MGHGSRTSTSGWGWRVANEQMHVQRHLVNENTYCVYRHNNPTGRYLLTHFTAGKTETPHPGRLSATTFMWPMTSHSGGEK